MKIDRQFNREGLEFAAKRRGGRIESSRIESKLTNRMIESTFCDRTEIRKSKLWAGEGAAGGLGKNANGVNKPGASIVETGNVP